LTYVGRKSGKLHRTPVNVFRAAGFLIAITYGRDSEWVRNVMALADASLRLAGSGINFRHLPSCMIPRGGRFAIPVGRPPAHRCERLHATFNLSERLV